MRLERLKSGLNQKNIEHYRQDWIMSGKKYSTEKFIEKAKQVHGDKYDYSKVMYNGAMEKVCIVCPIHGEFWQTPNSHLSGCGCRLCGMRSTKFKNDFVKRAIMVHGDKYDYSKTIVKDSLSKVDIICRKHGDFWMTPSTHLRGSGRPYCSLSKGEEKIEKFLREHDVCHERQYEIHYKTLFCQQNKIKVDFYIPSHNTFIEYNGQQHYNPIEKWGGQEELEKQQERDMALRQYCEECNIKLIEIPYTEFNNIDNILAKELKLQ